MVLEHNHNHLHCKARDSLLFACHHKHHFQSYYQQVDKGITKMIIHLHSKANSNDDAYDNQMCLRIIENGLLQEILKETNNGFNIENL